MTIPVEDQAQASKDMSTMEQFNYGELDAATKGFSVDTLVGRGSHGLVYKGVLGNGKHVAVKKPSPWVRQSGGGNACKLTEAEILTSMRSPHIVNLVGISSGLEEKLLVMEFMPNGSLHRLLHESPEPPTWRRRLVIALQVAQALQALHAAGPPVVHRDVKSSNVLLGTQGDAKLADFSLAVREGAGPQSEQVPAGTIGYMDPCYTGPTKLSVRNDIYSYGVLLLELISGRQVMDAASDTTSLVAWAVPLAKSGLVVQLCDWRTPLPCRLERAIRTVVGLAIRCVSTEASQRPSAGEMVGELQTVVVAVEQLRRTPLWIDRIRSNVCKGIQTWVKAWRMRKRSKLLATRILCEDHVLMMEGGETTSCRRIIPS